MSTDSSKPQHRPAVSAVEAAQMRGCSRQAVHKAARRGRLTTYLSAGTRLIVCDEKFEAWLGRGKEQSSNDTDANS